MTMLEDTTTADAVGSPLERSVMRPVAVLFARADSVYKTLPGVDVYDEARDARTYDGPHPVVAHPPCRSWGRLRAFAKPAAHERNLARVAVALVREFGGVLEHPAGSTLWPAQTLPKPGQRDQWGGWTLAAPQKWWGHRAEKATWFYVVGCEPSAIPDVPLTLGKAGAVIRLDQRRPDGTHIRKGDADWVPRLNAAENEQTPPELARWLVELARRCKAHNVEVSGCLRAPMPEDAPRTAAGSPLDRPVGPVAGA